MNFYASEIDLSVPFITIEALERGLQHNNEIVLGTSRYGNKPESIFLTNPLAICSGNYGKRVSLLRLVLFQVVFPGMIVECYNETSNTRTDFKNYRNITFHQDKTESLLKLLDTRLEMITNKVGNLQTICVVIEDVDTIVRDTLRQQVECLIQYSRILKIVPIFTTSNLEIVKGCDIIREVPSSTFSVDYIDDKRCLNLNAHYIDKDMLTL